VEAVISMRFLPYCLLYSERRIGYWLFPELTVYSPYMLIVAASMPKAHSYLDSWTMGLLFQGVAHFLVFMFSIALYS
jgi:hypothetical protein